MKGLGDQIRTLRKAKKLTLVEIAKTTGIDQATLSRIENGRMTGTLDSHRRIADALGVRLTDLYDKMMNQIAQAGDRRAVDRLQSFSHSHGAVSELLTTGVLQKKMMPVLLKLKPKGFTETEELPSFTERFIYITKGSIELTLGKEKRDLTLGQCFYFNASLPHHFRNRQKSESQLLSVITPTSL